MIIVVELKIYIPKLTHPHTITYRKTWPWPEFGRIEFTSIVICMFGAKIDSTGKLKIKTNNDNFKG